MYSLYCSREGIYNLVANSFQRMSVSPSICELGVFRGENAEKLINLLQPSRALLVDSYSSQEVVKNYSPFSEGVPFWVDDILTFSSFFGGPVNEQRTFDNLYIEAKSLLSRYQNATLLRSSTTSAAQKLLTTGEKFNYIYVDANHQYEFVLRDLIEWHFLLDDDGFLQLNDCTLSKPGIRQNLGVLRALHEFICRYPSYRVIAQSTGDFPDVLVVKAGSRANQAIEEAIIQSKIAYVEIPDMLVFNSKFTNGRMSYV
jgi:hypothetical protein